VLQIHGFNGLGGVEGLPLSTSPALKQRIAAGRQVRSLDAISSAIRRAREDGFKVTIATCGPLTNLALFVSVYPDLLENIERIVFMGGGVGIGNRSATSGKCSLYIYIFCLAIENIRVQCSL
jgi:uridine nucleosidase